MRIPKWLKALDARELLRDAFVFGGLASAVYGVSGFSASGAWILAGVVLFGLGMKR